ncbi:hepatitis A virus cellular receptor 2 homolog [Oreochromis niloticus]|uniref:hepatitis A virus cellular receptor 2 homolog n=1 Tax=Oreochromis niloticus TaxID=8128 RepID=UPI000DF3DDC4|nr:hepatitis A virus cellular receptor 2 homolog [Oreochromis niloticus]
MTAVSESLCCTLLLFVCVSADKKNITAESGKNVTLPCQALNTIIGVEWSRPDLNEEYVLLYRDGHFDPGSQHPSFKNRVDLQDRQMKDGDVSLILKDVTTADSGTYECRIRESKSRGIHEGGPNNIITLSVVDPPGQLIIEKVSVGEKINAPFGLIVAHSISAVLLVGGF